MPERFQGHKNVREWSAPSAHIHMTLKGVRTGYFSKLSEKWRKAVRRGGCEYQLAG